MSEQQTSNELLVAALRAIDDAIIEGRPILVGSVIRDAADEIERLQREVAYWKDNYTGTARRLDELVNQPTPEPGDAYVAGYADGLGKYATREGAYRTSPPPLHEAVDATRYRWLRDEANQDHDIWQRLGMYQIHGTEFDEAVDSARNALTKSAAR